MIITVEKTIQDDKNVFFPEIMYNDVPSSCDIHIAHMIGIGLREYQDILVRYGGHRVVQDGEVYFNKRQSVEQFIEKYLNPQLVMAALTENL